MKNKKSCAVFIILFLTIQFNIIESLFDCNDDGEENEVDHIKPELSDVIVEGYLVPGVSGLISPNQLLKIGLLGDLGHESGDHSWLGATLAAKEINEAGGVQINGSDYFIGIIAEDTDEADYTLDTAKAVAAAIRINTSDPHFIIGGFRTEALLAYQEIMMDKGIPFLCTGCSTDLLCENVENNYLHYKYFFRVMPINGTSIWFEFITYIVELCSALSIKYGGTLNKTAIIREDQSWTQELNTVLQVILPANNISVVQSISFPESMNEEDFNSIWEAINGSGAQLAIPLVGGSNAILMSKAYRSYKPKCLLAGINSYSQLDSYWDDTKGTCQYEIMMQSVYKTNKTSNTISFWDNFVGTYHISPYFTGVGSYDAVKLLANASMRIQSFGGDEIVAELERFNTTNPFLGASANIAFTNSHDLVEGYPYGCSLFCQWQLDGKKVVVPSWNQIYPDSISTGSISVPYWGINNLVGEQDLPGNFTLLCDTDNLAEDEAFNLTWTHSAGADSYSIFIYNKSITYINKSLTLIAEKNASSPHLISGLNSGEYYCVIVAYNETGEMLSNNVHITVSYYPPAINVLLIILIVCIIVITVLTSGIVLKKKISSGNVEVVRKNLEKKMGIVKHQINERKIKLANKNLSKIKVITERYDFPDISADVVKKIELCKEIETEIQKEIFLEQRKQQKMQLEEKMQLVDGLIKERKIKLANKNLNKIKDTAEQHNFPDIINDVNKKLEYCEELELEIHEEKKEQVKMQLEEQMQFVDSLIKERKTKLANKNLIKIKDTAELYDLIDVYNDANKRIKYCEELELEIQATKKEQLVLPAGVKEEEKEYNLFISYSTLDTDYYQIKEIAKQLKTYPNINKVLYWEKDSEENIVEFMDRTLKESNVFILFCTENSLKSTAVKDEWQAAFQRRKKDLLKMIPVYEDEDFIPPILGHLLNVKYTKDDFEGFIEKLYQEILR